MEKENILSEIDRRMERKLEEISKSLIRASICHRVIKKMIDSGYYDPVLEYWNFTDGGTWLYVTLPLDKALFNKVVKELISIGWRAGDINLSENSASCTLKGCFFSDEFADDFVLHMSAYGVGVNCRIVTLEKGQYKEGVYEWVCEEGAKEMENLNGDS